MSGKKARREAGFFCYDPVISTAAKHYHLIQSVAE